MTEETRWRALRAAALLGLGILLTGALLVFCLPLGERGYLAWIALVPLLLATRGRGFLLAFCSSLACLSFAAWLSSAGLLYSVRGNVKEDAWLYTGFGIFGFSFALALGIWGEAGTLRMKPWWFAALAVLLESVLLLKLPAHLGLSQYRNALMVQLASIGGIWLVSFLVWWSNFALANVLLATTPWSDRRKRALIAIAPAFLAVTLSSAWQPDRGKRETIAALQIAECDEESMTLAQREAARRGVNLAVWPEFGGLGMAHLGDTTTLRQMAGPPFVTSFRDDFQPLPHNVAALFADGTESKRYAKRKLFGEENKMHSAGNQAIAVNEIGLNICFDSCFPFVIRETALLGAGIVALPTIDPPSTNGFIAAVHASYTPFRAAENGVMIVRADGYAYSMIVDRRGHVVAEAPPGDNVLVAQASVGPRWTFYKWLGDWWLWLSGATVLCPLLLRLKRGQDEASTRSKDLLDSPVE